MSEGPSALIRTLDFLQAYEHLGSQKKVADRRGVAPATISEAFKSLNSAVPNSLTGQRPLQELVQTDEAQRVLEAGARVLAAAEEFVAVYREYRGWRAISVATYNAQIKNVLAPAILAFNSKSGPSTQIILPPTMGGFRRVHHNDLQPELRSGYSDYILASVPDGTKFSDDIMTEDLYTFRLLVIASPDHELMKHSELSIDELVRLADTGFLIGPDGYLSREVFRAISTQSDWSLNIAMENPDTNTRVALALAGYGIALAHNDSIDPKFQGDYPVLVGDSDIVTSGRAVVAWMPAGNEAHPVNVSPHDHELFIDSLKQSVAGIH